jgi:flagellar motor switch protein FliN/FliY
MSISQADIDALLASAGDLAGAAQEEDAVASPARGRTSQVATASRPASCSRELARIHRLSVPVIVTLAERSIALESTLGWTAGSIIEFDVPADSELRLVIANKSIGLGHAVKVGENFGLRVTYIGDVTERIKALGGR